MFRKLKGSVSSSKGELTMEQRKWHGSLGSSDWPLPVLAAEADEMARPGYQTKKADEYLDTPDVLRAKVAVLADLLRRSKNACAYTGAGISTASGIADYATKAKSSVRSQRPKLNNPFEAQPTLSHRVLTALGPDGSDILKYWVQQNHDGLPQKAGFPQELLNEIHGSWYDPSNPVVPMDGKLRGDLCASMYEWEKRTDLCLSLGTTMCGMNADRMAVTPAKKARTGKALGLVIVTLQETQYDDLCSLRIFARLDDCMALLAEELKLSLPAIPAHGPVPPTGEEADVFMVPYDATGGRSSGSLRRLDLRPGARITITSGPSEGCPGFVKRRDDEGHYLIQCEGQTVRERTVRVLGRWWVQGSLDGMWPSLPIVNSEETHDPPRPQAPPKPPANFFSQLGLPPVMIQRPSALRITQTHSQISGSEYHSWALAIEFPSSYPVPLSDMIASVEYRLHPTFDPSSVLVTEAPFALPTMSGWGTFEVTVVINWAPGRGPPLEAKHSLRFDTDACSTTVAVPPLKMDPGFLANLTGSVALRPTQTRVTRTDGSSYVEERAY